MRNFLERFLRTPMDNGQRAHLIKIAKQDNEYTVDLQLRNRTALLFRHILSPPVNGRAAMLQSVIITVAFSQGRKVDPPFEQAIDPLEFVTFMSGVPGFNTGSPAPPPTTGSHYDPNLRKMIPDSESPPNP